MSHITINKNLDLSPLFSKPSNDLSLDEIMRPKKRGAPETTYSIQQKIKDQLQKNQRAREEETENNEQEEQPEMEVEQPEQPEEKEEQNEEEDIEQIEKTRQDCLLQITQYINRVPHLLKGYAAKDLTAYIGLSLDQLEKELGVIEIVTMANLNPLNGRRMHNTLWKGLEYGILSASNGEAKINGFSERVKIPEEVKNVQQLLTDVVDLMDIRYFGRKTMPLPLIYLAVTGSCLLEYHNQNVDAIAKRGETLVAASEAGKFVPLDLQEEAKAFLTK